MASKNGWVRSFAAASLVTAFLALNLPLIAETARLQVPFYRQEKNGCGPASVAMVQSYWAAQHAGPAAASEAEVYAKLSVSADQGTLLSDMRQYMESKGYHAFTIQASPSDLSEQLSKGRAPLVALQTHGGGSNADLHYVVVTGLDEHKVWLNDPAKRKPGSVDRSKFEESWNRGGGWMLLAVPR